MELTGYFLSIFIGITLGLIGGGGSILTVPLLVYLFGVEPIMATAYSMFVVGTSSLVGVFSKYKQKLVCFNTALIFGIPSILSVLITRKFILPAIPSELFSIGGFIITKSLGMMILFATLMIIASSKMIRKKPIIKVDNATEVHTLNYKLIILQGLLVGTLTGLVGAGGGFLIIPAIIILAKLPMKKAVGTSLLIIATNSLIGFIGDLSLNASHINWQLLLTITSLSITGIFIGNKFSTQIDGAKLKIAFGWFILIMGSFIILNELFLKLGVNH